MQISGVMVSHHFVAAATTAATTNHIPTPSLTRPLGLLDDGVRFLPGFFNTSLGPVFGPAAVEAAETGEGPVPPVLAVIRIDADAYDGVRDALEALYPRLSIGGVVIIDDFHLVGGRVSHMSHRNIGQSHRYLIPTWNGSPTHPTLSQY